jgi:N-acetylmuramoyl-L-alanine amidase
MTSAEGARDWLCNPESQVSAHYVISETGTLWHLVEDTERAWHAGAGQWGSVVDVNSRSIGIELANTGSQPFAEPQMATLEAVLERLLAQWEIAAHRVIGHSDLALGRKVDPGAKFDWHRLARQGLSIWPRPRAAGDFFEDARRFGYICSEGSEPALLKAFRDRFRPGACGELCTDDAALMADLAARWPADPEPYSTS